MSSPLSHCIYVILNTLALHMVWLAAFCLHCVTVLSLRFHHREDNVISIAAHFRHRVRQGIAYYFCRVHNNKYAKVGNV